MIQEVVDKIVASVFYSENPIRELIPTVKGEGQAYVFNRRISSTASWGSAITDTGSFTEADGTYVKVMKPYAIYGTTVKVTKFARAITANYIDILEQELTDRIREFKEWEQRAIIFGRYVAPYDANTFAQGLLSQILTDLPTANVVDANGQLTLSKIDEALDMCQGRPSLIICSRGTRRKLNALLQAQQMFVNEVEIKGGIRVLEIAGVPVLTSSAIPDTIQFGIPDGSPTAIASLTGGNQSLMLILDLEDVLIAELQPLTVEKVPTPSSQYEQYDIYEYITPVVKNPLRHAVIVRV
ncbi:MAG: hypothetical protein QXW71_00925 [Thermoplasmata archaeon]